MHKGTPRKRRTNPLKEFKVERKMTTAQLAKLLGYQSVDAVYRLFRYENKPSTQVAERIAHLLNVGLGTVLEDYAVNVKRAA